MLNSGWFWSLVLDGNAVTRASIAFTERHTPCRGRDGVEGAHEERSSGISPTEKVMASASSRDRSPSCSEGSCEIRATVE
jgi:hypothetical protein